MIRSSIFYKYTSAETGAKILDTGRLRWSSPMAFNDLSEFQVMPRFEPTVEEGYKKLTHVIADYVYGDTLLNESKLAPLIKLLVGICSAMRASGLSKDFVAKQLHQNSPLSNDQFEYRLREAFEGFNPSSARVLCVTPDYDNEVMWAHYASCHTGCALGFRHLTDLDTPLLAARPVKYYAQPPIVGSGLDFLLYGETKALREGLHK